MYSTLGCQSGRSCNTGTHAGNPPGQTALSRLPIRDVLQYRHTYGQLCEPDHTQKCVSSTSSPLWMQSSTRDKPQHRHTCGQPCQPDSTQKCVSSTSFTSLGAVFVQGIVYCYNFILADRKNGHTNQLKGLSRIMAVTYCEIFVTDSGLNLWLNSWLIYKGVVYIRWNCVHDLPKLLVV